MAQCIQVNFDPTLWSAGFVGSGWGSNGKDCGTIIPDKDGHSLWCFEYFGNGFARVDIRDGSIIQQDALLGSPGCCGLDSRENGSVALFTQDSHGFYYTSLNSVIYKFHIPNVTGPYTPNGTLLNGYAVVDATYDYSALTTSVEDWALAEIGGTVYLAACTTKNGIASWARGFIFNATTMTYVDTYTGEGDNLSAGNTIMTDANGIFWMCCFITPIAGQPTPVDAPPNSIDATLVKLDMTTGSLVHSIQTVTSAEHGLSYAPFFVGYIPSINGMFLAPFDNHSTDGVSVVSMNTWTGVALHPDDLRFLVTLEADSTENSLNTGVQNGKLMIEGSVSLPTQTGGLLQVIDAATLDVIDTFDCVALMTAAGVENQAEATSYFNVQNGFVTSCSSDGTTATATFSNSNIVIPPSTRVLFHGLTGATWFNNHNFSTLISSVGNVLTFADNTGHGAFGPTTENAPYSLAGTLAVAIPSVNTFGYQESLNKVGACFLFSGTPLYIFGATSSAATVNQITGGGFIDSLGNPLANGYLVFTLNQSAIVNTTTQVCAGREIIIPLDSSGNVITSPAYSLWPNNVLTPTDTFYVVSAYSKKGQLVWGPNAQTILSSPSPYNISSWIVGNIN